MCRQRQASFLKSEVLTLASGTRLIIHGSPGLSHTLLSSGARVQQGLLGKVQPAGQSTSWELAGSKPTRLEPFDLDSAPLLGTKEQASAGCSQYHSAQRFQRHGALGWVRSLLVLTLFQEQSYPQKGMPSQLCSPSLALCPFCLQGRECDCGGPGLLAREKSSHPR